MKKTILTLFLFLFLLDQKAEAAKVLPRFKGKSTGRASISSGLGVSPRLRSDRQALLVTFSNLKKVKNVSYTLIYQTNGKDEGVSGSVDASAGNVVNRELLFGTCSGGVCRGHGNITNMRLEIISELSSGKRTIRRFRIRV